MSTEYQRTQWVRYVRLMLADMTEEEIYDELFQYELDHAQKFVTEYRRDRIIAAIEAEKRQKND